MTPSLCSTQEPQHGTFTSQIPLERLLCIYIILCFPAIALPSPAISPISKFSHIAERDLDLALAPFFSKQQYLQLSTKSTKHSHLSEKKTRNKIHGAIHHPLSFYWRLHPDLPPPPTPPAASNPRSIPSNHRIPHTTNRHLILIPFLFGL